MNAGEFSRVLIEQVNESYWKVTFASRAHFYEMDTVAELRKLADQLHQPGALRVVLIEFANLELYPKGGDITEDGGNSTVIEAGVFTEWNRIVRYLSEAPIILVSVIRGVVRGRITDLVMACDVRFASRERASFGHPEISWGVIPRAEAIEKLVQAMGASRALEILASCDDYDSEVAEKYGLVNRTIPDWQLDDFVNKYVRRVSSYDKHVLAGLKQRIKEVSEPAHRDTKKGVVWYEDTSVPSEKVFAPFWLKSASPVPPYGHRYRLNRPTIGIRCDSELRAGHFIGELWDS